MDGQTPVRRTPRPRIAGQSVPRLPRHVQLRHDRTRERWVILAPERVLVPDETAAAVLRLVDGSRSVAEIAADLAQAYAAPVELILGDCVTLLQDLADKGFLVTVAERSDG